MQGKQYFMSVLSNRSYIQHQFNFTVILQMIIFQLLLLFVVPVDYYYSIVEASKSEEL